MTHDASQENTVEALPPIDVRSSLRIGDRERETASQLLSTATAEGRISLGELEARTARLLQAQTTAELAVLTADLQAQPKSAQRTEPTKKERGNAELSLVQLGFAMLAIFSIYGLIVLLVG